MSELPEFMSPEHVATMNALLDDAPEVKEACAALDREHRIVYRLSDGPDGDEVFWELAFSPMDGARFTLDEPTGPADLTFRCPWPAMITGAAAQRRGETADIPVTTDGDPAVMERIGPAFAAAQQVATVDVRFPEV